MARKKKPIHDIPESVCLFNTKEIEYINFTAKSIPYRIDIQTATINVPPDHFDRASEDLHIRHLINKFAFVVQATIGAEYIDKSFKPTLRETVKAEADPFEIEMPKRGQVWLYGKDRWYIAKADKDSYTITYLESMAPDGKRSVSEIKELITHGRLCIEPRV